jgi:hypothetical protein
MPEQIHVKIRQALGFQFFKQGIPVVFEYAINKTYERSLDATLLIVYYQRHVSAW